MDQRVFSEKTDTSFHRMSPTLFVFQDTAGEPLYKLYKALKHQVEKGPVDAKMKKAKYTLNDTGLLGDDVEYSVLVSTQTPSNTKRHVKRLMFVHSAHFEFVVRLTGVFVTSDPAGVGARGGTRCDSGEGVEL